MKNYVSLRKAAQLLGLSPSTVHRWLHHEGLPHYQPMGPKGRILICMEDLDQWLAARQQNQRKLEPSKLAVSRTRPPAVGNVLSPERARVETGKPKQNGAPSARGGAR